MHPLAVISSLLLFATISGASAQELIDLGDLGNGETMPTAINNSGQVVGFSRTARRNLHAFLYANGKMTDLDPLGSDSMATGINEAGDIVGMSKPSAGGTTQAFLYSGGQMKNLGMLPGEFTSSASAINNHGQIVGISGSRTFLYYQGKMGTIGLLPGGSESRPAAINDAGQIVGTADTGEGHDHAFLFADGRMTDLGVIPGGRESQAVGVNDSGEISGYSTTPDGFQDAFLYAHGQMTDLGTLPGCIRSLGGEINRSGEIAGTAYVREGDVNSTAFVYTVAKGFQDLNTLYASLLVPDRGAQAGFIHLNMSYALNDRGDIVGVGQYWDGISKKETRAFLLKPGVPFLGPLLWTGGGLLVLGLLILMIYLWRLPVPSVKEPVEEGQNSSPARH